MERNNLPAKIDNTNETKSNFAKFLYYRNIHEDWICWLLDVFKNKTIREVIQSRKLLPDMKELFFNLTLPWKNINTLMLFDIKNTFAIDKYPMADKTDTNRIRGTVSNFHKILAKVLIDYDPDIYLRNICKGDYLEDSGIVSQYIQFLDTSTYNIPKSSQIKNECIDLNISLIKDMLYYKTSVEISSFHVIVFSNTSERLRFSTLKNLFDVANKNAKAAGNNYTYSIQFLCEITEQTKASDIESIEFPNEACVDLYFNLTNIIVPSVKQIN